MRSLHLFSIISVFAFLFKEIKSLYYPDECAKSCAKSSCQFVSNPSCAMQNPTFDQKTSVGAMKCKQCKQSTETKCLKQNLEKTFSIGGNNVTAVYCNDEYLVIWSLGQPHHETHLEYIPRPPGGSDLPYEQSNKMI